MNFLNNYIELESTNDACSPSVILLRLADYNVEFGEELKLFENQDEFMMTNYNKMMMIIMTIMIRIVMIINDATNDDFFRRHLESKSDVGGQGETNACCNHLGIIIIIIFIIKALS